HGDVAGLAERPRHDLARDGDIQRHCGAVVGAVPGNVGDGSLVNDVGRVVLAGLFGISAAPTAPAVGIEIGGAFPKRHSRAIGPQRTRRDLAGFLGLGRLLVAPHAQREVAGLTAGGGQHEAGNCSSGKKATVEGMKQHEVPFPLAKPVSYSNPEAKMRLRLRTKNTVCSSVYRAGVDQPAWNM